MKQIELGNLDVTITADDTAFIVEIGGTCFAETYMDQQPYRWPNPADNGRLWGYIKGPASVRIPVPDPGKHELELLIGGRLFKCEHDFPDPNAEPTLEPDEPEEPEQPAEEPIPEEPAQEPEPEHPTEEPAQEPEQPEKPEPYVNIKASIIRDLIAEMRDIAAMLDALMAVQEAE